MTMPKATIYKNDRSVFAQYNIRMPRKSRVIQSISETTTKQEFPYQQFRLCILPFIADIQRCLCSLVSLSIIVVQITSYSFKEVFIITVYYFPYPVLSPTFPDNELHICHSLYVFTHLAVRNAYIHSHFGNRDSRIRRNHFVNDPLRF